jgi:hypothetical protein
MIRFFVSKNVVLHKRCSTFLMRSFALLLGLSLLISFGQATKVAFMSGTFVFDFLPRPETNPSWEIVTLTPDRFQDYHFLCNETMTCSSRKCSLVSDRDG